MLDEVMSRFYEPGTILAEVHASFGTDEFATMLFTMNATTRWGQTYRNQYTITIQAANGRIVRVYELCDTQHLDRTRAIANTECIQRTVRGLKPDSTISLTHV
jgi:hypothetical protein